MPRSIAELESMEYDLKFIYYQKISFARFLPDAKDSARIDRSNYVGHLQSGTVFSRVETSHSLDTVANSYRTSYQQRCQYHPHTAELRSNRT